MKPHKHADIIKAWADGAEIEVRLKPGRYGASGGGASGGGASGGWAWKSAPDPTFGERCEYRVKPKTPELLPTIMTASGRYFDYLDPKPESIDIEDIARHLSKICRFTGATSEFYSVAQHSVYVSALVPEPYKMTGLMHDATEAYVGDVNRPLKNLLPEYKVIEERVWKAISAKFDLPPVLPSCIKDADNIMLLTEKRDFMTNQTLGPRKEWAWADGIGPLPDRLTAWDPTTAYNFFMDTFNSLTRAR